MTIITVPKIAGKTPPSVFDSRGSSETNSQALWAYWATFAPIPMAFGKYRSTTWASGSSFCLPPSAVTTMLAICRARSSPSRAACAWYWASSLASSSPRARACRTLERALTLELSEPEPDALLPVVDRPDVVGLDRPDLATSLSGLREEVPELPLVGDRAGQDDRPRLAHLPDGADQRAPLGPLDDRDLRRSRSTAHLALVDPHEISAVEVAVGDLQLDAVLSRLPRNRLALDDLAGDDLPVAQRQPRHGRGPEEAETVHQDEADQSRDHQEGQAQRAPGDPDERLAGPPETLHR